MLSNQWWSSLHIIISYSWLWRTSRCQNTGLEIKCLTRNFPVETYHKDNHFTLCLDNHQIKSEIALFRTLKCFARTVWLHVFDCVFPANVTLCGGRSWTLPTTWPCIFYAQALALNIEINTLFFFFHIVNMSSLCLAYSCKPSLKPVSV